MNSTIQTYIQQAALFFPVLGKAERDYLVRLAQSISDYFSEQPPESVEAIAQAFGPPQQAVKDYLAAADTQAIVRRIRSRKYIRVCLSVLVSLCLLILLLAVVHISWPILFF